MPGLPRKPAWVALVAILLASPAPGAPSARARWRERVAAGQRAQAARRLDVAESRWLEAYKLAKALPEGNAELIETLRALTQLYRAQGRKTATIASLKRLLAVEREEHGQGSSKLVPTRSRLGELLVAAGDAAGAIEVLEPALPHTEGVEVARSTTLLRVLESLGEAYRVRGRLPEARAVMERVLAGLEARKEMPAETLRRMRWLVAGLAFRTDAPARAAELLEAVIDHDMSTPRGPGLETVAALQMRGEALARAGRAAKGIEVLARAVETAGTLPDLADEDLAFLLLAQARVLADAGKPAESLASLDAALASLQAAGKSGADLAEVRAERGHVLSRLGRLPEARTAFQRALDLLPASDPRNAATRASVLVLLGRLEVGAEAPQAARPLLEEALGLLEEEGRGGPETLSMVLLELAAVHGVLGAPLTGEPMARRALGLRASGGGDGPAIAEAEIELARLERTLGKLAEAEAHAEGALARIEATRGKEHPALVPALLVRGRVRAELGRDEEAEADLARAQALAGKPGVEPGVADEVAAAYARVLVRRNKNAEAGALLKKALEAHRQGGEGRRREVIEDLGLLARVARGQRDWKGAAARGQEALALAEEVHGGRAGELVPLLLDLAETPKARGAPLEGVPQVDRALALAREARGALHPETATALHERAVLHRIAKEPGKAETLYNQALAIRRRSLGPGHPDTAETLNHLATLKFEAGKVDEAERLFRDTLAIWERIYGPEHERVGRLMNNLGNLAARKGNDSEAQLALGKAREIFAREHGVRHPTYLSVVRNLAAHHRNQGRVDEAKKLEAELVAAAARR